MPGTDILMVLDKSGSMEPITDDTIGSFNSFINEQKAVPGEAKVTVWLFDTVRHMPLYRRVPLSDVKPMDRSQYVAGGTTALLDAVAMSIDEAGRWYDSLPPDQKPERVIMVIQTDGMENASREYKPDQVFDRIKHQKEKYGWAFIFLGANQDAWTTGQQMGIGHTLSYDADAQGTRAAYAHVSESVAAFRQGRDLADVDLDIRESD
jgi:hypothetical protein